MTSPAFRPAFSAGPPLLDRTDQRAARPVEAEGLGERCVHVLDRTPMRPRVTLPCLTSCSRTCRDVDRDRERQAHEAAGAAVDLRVDADHFACMLNSGPPELPGFTATSVWMNGT